LTAESLDFELKSWNAFCVASLIPVLYIVAYKRVRPHTYDAGNESYWRFLSRIKHPPWMTQENVVFFVLLSIGLRRKKTQ